MKSLSQISEDLYQLGSSLLKDDGSGIAAYNALDRIRRDLEPHIVATHDTPGEGIEQPAGSVWCLDFCVDYEGASTIRCFANEADARRLLATIEAYPPEPDCPDLGSSDFEWVQYDRDKTAWFAGHPLGPEHSLGVGGHYVVRELKISPPVPAALTGDQTLA